LSSQKKVKSKVSLGFFLKDHYICRPFKENKFCYAKNEDPFQREETLQVDWIRENQAFSGLHFAHDAEQK
jgi:hypothetical protein